MALRVFNLGETVVSANSNENTPTTPVATTESAYTNTNAIISAVYPDDTTQESIHRITSASNVGTEYSNLEKTEGNILKVYDSFSAEGIDLSSISSSDLNTNYYFVMIHSDDSLKHHFARITSIHTSDAYGDSIKFEPSLGNEIIHGVKFKLFKGPLITSDFKAIGLGISGDLQNKLNISRPYYWFKPELKNQLEHNTKYFLRTNEIHQSNLTSLSFNSLSTPLFTTFLTNQGYSGEVKDYGKFSLKTKLIDNLRILDTTDEVTFTGDIHATNFPTEIRNITTISSGTINDLLYRGITKSGVPDGTYVTAILGADSVQLSQSTTVEVTTTSFIVSNANESHSIATRNFTDYETSFFNARRDGDDLILPSSSNYTSRGSTRYLHYDFSNDKVNYTYNVMDMNIEESIKGKVSLSDVSIADMMKIYPSKLDIDSSLRVRQRLNKSSLNNFVNTGLTVGANGLLTGVDGSNNLIVSVHIIDVNDYFTVGEEIKIEDRLYVILSINSTTHTIRLLQADLSNDGIPNTYSRLETESSYTDIGTPVINTGDSVFRRAYSPFNKTLITPFELTSTRIDDLYLVSSSINSIYNFFKCASLNNNLLTFTVELDKYLEEGLHLNGEYYLYYEKLNGTIESLDYRRQEGQSIMKVQGRDIMSKVLSPVISKNAIFSEDIVYSTRSPLNDLVFVAYVEATFNSQTITVKNASNADQSVSLIAGDKLYAETHTNNGKFVKLIGTVNVSATSATHVLQDYSQVNCGGDTYSNEGVFKLYKAKRNATNPISNISFNKALASNILVDSVTSLSGTSDKGLFFTSGSSLDSTGIPLSSDKLVGTSSSNNAKAVGYFISKVEGDINGADYQCVLGDGQETETHQNISLSNTLIDYTILEIKESKSFLELEIAPYVPFTLGRLEINLANDYDSTLNKIGFTAGSTAGQERNYLNISSSSTSNVLLLTTSAAKRGDSLFIGGVFKGIVMDEYISGLDTIIVLDRNIQYETGQEISILGSVMNLPKSGSLQRQDDKDTHELELINIEHLHGGKMISNVHFFRSARSFSPLDVQLKYTSGGLTSFQKYGNPLYSIYSIEKGNEINYAASYKLNSKRKDIVKSRRQYSPTHNHLPLEARGYFTPTFSNFDDKQILGNASAEKTYTYPYDYSQVTNSPLRLITGRFNTSRAKERLLFRQKSVDRMFIFVNSDEQPYHDNRDDSLANSTIASKDISKYNIMGILPTQSTNTQDDKENEISTTRHTNIDSDYSSAGIISSDKNLDSLSNVGIMRLTEIVVDWAFNQIDPEKELVNTNADNLISKKYVPIQLDGDTQYYLQSSSYSLDLTDTTIQFYTAASGGSAVNFSSINTAATSPLVQGDVLVTDDANNNYIGHIDDTNNLVLPPCFANSDKSAFYTGAVKKISSSEIVGFNINGRGNRDSFIGSDSSTNRYRTGFFNSPSFASNQKYVTIDNNTTLAVHHHSATDGTPAPSENWFAHQFYDSNGSRVGYFFWFNVETPSHGNIDIIPDTYGSAFSGNNHPTGTNYTAVEIQLSDGYSEIDFNNAIEAAYNSVNLRTNHVYGGDIANDPLAYSYGGTLNTQWRTKRNAVEDAYIVETSAVASHAIIFTIAKVNVDITADGVGWGKTSSAYHSKWGETLGGTINNYVSTPRIGGAYLPVSIATTFSSSVSTYSDIMNSILNSPLSTSYADVSSTNSNEMIYKGFIPVSFNGFVIEDSKEKKKISVGETFPSIEGLFRRQHTNMTIFGLLSNYSTWFNKYSYYLDFGANKAENTNLPDEGNGMMIGFKPRLKGTHATLIAGTYKESSGSRVYPYSFETDNTDVAWLLDLDLTGCYLLRQSDTNTDDNYFTEGYSFTYVISHEINPTDPSKVILTLDSNLGSTSTYKILQPNHTTFYEFSPTDINIGYLSSSYTKKPNTNECYTSLKSHAATDATLEDTDGINDMEGIGSMYVLLDLSGKVNADDRLVNQSMSSNFWNNLPKTICLSDGKTSFKTGLSTKGYNLRFDSLKTLKGITSMSEIVTVKVNKNFNKNSKRCLIGNTVKIVSESEKLANTLLADEKLEITIKNELDYPLFIAPNFQGNDLLSAIRFLLNKKDRDIEIIDGNFVIDNEDANDKYVNVLLSENGKYSIYEYEKEETNINLYNEIIVYGSSHKAVKKDLRSIKKVGRKTLEVFDNKLVTQEETEEEARQLLKIHSKLNASYRVTVATKGLELLKSGDIIQFELVRENIQREEYLVLSIHHRLTGLMELELGKYSDSLDDKLVDIIRQGKETKSYLRSEKFSENISGIETLETIKIKEIRALIRKRSTTGSPLTLGFGTTLNTSTYQLGFEGGQTIVITNLQEKLL